MRTPLTAALSIVALAAGAAFLGAARPAHEAPAATAAEASTYKVDSVHSSVMFRISHLGVSGFYGRFNDVSGTLVIDPDKADGSSIDISVASDSVDSKNTQRDGHLKSPDFFNAKQFPTITFKSTKLTKSGEGYKAEGNLTLLGVSKPVTIDLAYAEKDAGERFGHRAGVEGSVTIKRSDYGMTFYLDNGALGDEVKLFIGLEGQRK